MRKKILLKRAKQLRSDQTDSEKLLWLHLRSRRFLGFKFRRQVTLGRYILDFVCYEKRLIIEIDGGQHNEHIFYDSKRTKWLQKQGFQIIRYWNNEVIGKLEVVLDDILLRLDNIDPSP